MPVFAGQSREELRRAYLDAWRRSQAGAVLSPLEAQLAAVIAEHPEYHAWLEGGEAALAEEFGPERGRTNPFLHLGMHLAIREQVATDRPGGIRALHALLAIQAGGPREAEHRMMEALGETLWEAQRAGRAPDEQAYLERLKRLR
ncbi:MAG: DUF1841 family protein [Steroidobacteraceae bacterium]|jgi:hypothetical protein|nr:DUF1841 family protein [Steroidobacteraceae bacterium]